jgi:hypothetical protein
LAISSEGVVDLEIIDNHKPSLCLFFRQNEENTLRLFGKLFRPGGKNCPRRIFPRREGKIE